MQIMRKWTMKIAYHTRSKKDSDTNTNEKVKTEEEETRKREAARIRQQKRHVKEDYKTSVPTCKKVSS